MKNLFRISLMMISFVSFLLVGACSDEEIDTRGKSKYGFIQLKLQKKGATKGLVEGGELDYLREARKIELVMMQNNRTIRQSVNLHAVNDQAAEFGLTSDRIQVLAGNYDITGYVIYGQEVTADNRMEILQIADLEEPLKVTVEQEFLTNVQLAIEAQLTGKLALILDKDMSGVQPDENQWKKSVATQAEYDNFNYASTDSVTVFLRYGQNGAALSYTFKAKQRNKELLLSTDTLNLPEGQYTMTQFQLRNAKREIIYAATQQRVYDVKHFELTRDTVNVAIQMNGTIRDGIALRNIWEAMDGANWYYQGQNSSTGVNWLFTYADGTPRPVDAWTRQPGVSIDNNGRVKGLDLGSFNPVGMVPDAIGDLTELEILYLGTHSDAGNSIDPSEGEKVLDTYALYLQGVDLQEARWDIARERSLIRYGSIAKKGTLGFKSENERPIRYATTMAQFPGDRHNRITGISEAIGKLKKLNTLNIANGLVSKLPASIAQLSNLTDLEIYNCRLDEFPTVITQLPELISLNMSGITGLSSDKFVAGLQALCDGSSKKKIQLLYLNRNSLKALPDNIGNLTKLGLLDIAYNDIEAIAPMSKVALVHAIFNFNKLKVIPENFCKVEDIEIFAVENNALTVFPGFLSNLETIYRMDEVNLSFNKISSFPASFKGIRAEQVNLNGNQLGGNTTPRLLPSALSDTNSEIDYLLISNNDLDSIPFTAFQNMKSLQALECSGNLLKYLPGQFHNEYLPWLSGLDFSNNQFRQFPEVVLNLLALNNLNVSSQGYFKNSSATNYVRTMTEWPANLNKHFTLKILNMSGNDFRKVQNFPTNVNYLNISDNPNIFMTVPSEIISRIINGSFGFVFDEDQHLVGITE